MSFLLENCRQDNNFHVYFNMWHPVITGSLKLVWISQIHTGPRWEQLIQTDCLTPFGWQMGRIIESIEILKILEQHQQGLAFVHCPLPPVIGRFAPGARPGRQFWLPAVFLVRYANNEWNMNFACGVRKTNVLFWSGALSWRSSTQNLCNITCQALRGDFCPGLSYSVQRPILRKMLSQKYSKYFGAQKLSFLVA